MVGKTIIFTVTNDLTYDQRMIRICNSLATHGFRVLLVGRKLAGSLPPAHTAFQQKRLSCFFTKGFLFYAEYNLRLFMFLLFQKMDIICAIDLDTILPCYFVSRIRRISRVYDAHELFCEMKEIVTRPRVYAVWKRIEKMTVPHFRAGYTVNAEIATAFYKMYKVKYSVIRNMPLLQPMEIPPKPEKYILYQGAVNEGRCFETLIPAMAQVNARLLICGDGNFLVQAKELVCRNQLENKVVFMGKIQPEALRTITLQAYIGVTLFDDKGLSNYYSLANRFFDYMHAGLPQICIDFPVYRDIIQQFPFALLVSNTDAEHISAALNQLLSDDEQYGRLQQNCLRAREILNWQTEEKILLSFYEQLIAES